MSIVALTSVCIRPENLAENAKLRVGDIVICENTRGLSGNAFLFSIRHAQAIRTRLPDERTKPLLDFLVETAVSAWLRNH